MGDLHRAIYVAKEALLKNPSLDPQILQGRSLFYSKESEARENIGVEEDIEFERIYESYCPKGMREENREMAFYDLPDWVLDDRKAALSLKSLIESIKQVPKTLDNDPKEFKDLCEAIKKEELYIHLNKILDQSKDEVSKWYKKTSLACHPDKVMTRSEAVQKACEGLFKLANNINELNQSRPN